MEPPNRFSQGRRSGAPGRQDQFERATETPFYGQHTGLRAADSRPAAGTTS